MKARTGWIFAMVVVGVLLVILQSRGTSMEQYKAAGLLCASGNECTSKICTSLGSADQKKRCRTQGWLDSRGLKLVTRSPAPATGSPIYPTPFQQRISTSFTNNGKAVGLLCASNAECMSKMCTSIGSADQKKRCRTQAFIDANNRNAAVPTVARPSELQNLMSRVNNVSFQLSAEDIKRIGKSGMTGLKLAFMTFFTDKRTFSGLKPGSFPWSFGGRQVKVHAIAVHQKHAREYMYKILRIRTRKGEVFGHVIDICDKDDKPCFEKNVAITGTNDRINKQDMFLIDLHQTGWADAKISDGVEYVLYDVVGFRGLKDISSDRYKDDYLFCHCLSNKPGCERYDVPRASAKRCNA